ncbi:MAG: PIN domain-containing protein [Actinobacteria bacterium]|nr:PIN domain-containing protein [Actinomycetota bacterium]
MALVLDTGVVYAALDESDSDHDRCAALVSETKEQLVIPQPVCVEVDYWIRKNANVDAWLAFCEDIVAGAYSLWSVDGDLLLRAAQLQVQFADQPIGFVDASVFATCESLGEDKVATLDRRHFGVLRTGEGKQLRLLP